MTGQDSHVSREEPAQQIASAICELIENSYDADASHVLVEINTDRIADYPALHFKNTSHGFIKVQDDGIGIAREELQRSWSNLSYSAKRFVKGKNPTQKMRPYQGGKGTGRQQTIVLGSKVEIYTMSKVSGESTHLAFDWNQFRSDAITDNASAFIEESKNYHSHGTTFIVHPLNSIEYWNEAFWREVREKVKNRAAPLLSNTFRVVLCYDGIETELGQRIEPKRLSEIEIHVAWQKMSPDLIKEVVAFWDNNKMIKPGFSSEERARQVVLILRDKDTKTIVGLSTAGLVTFKQLNNNNFYLYRSIILPAYRHPGLTSRIIVDTRDYLESLHAKEEVKTVIGMLSFVENPRIQQFRREAIWPASKMAYIGMDKDGRHIRVYYFKGARI